MKKLPLLLIFLIALASQNAFAGAIVITSAFEPSTANVGDFVAFVVTVNGDSGSNMTGEVPAVPGLLVSTVPGTANQVQIINGSIRSYTRFSYQCRATKEGTYTVPAYTVSIDGKEYTVASATLSIVKSGDEQNDAVRVEIDAPETLYVGQSAPETVRFLIREGVNPVPGSLAPQRSGDGIAQEPFDNTLITTPTVVRGSTRYATVTIPTTITALNPGDQTLAYDVDIEVRVPKKRASADPYSDLDDPFERMMQNMHKGLIDDMNSTVKTLHARGEAKIKVTPLPPNPPASFDGAVGQFSLSGTLSSRKTKVGEPVELSVEILADGGLRQLPAPKLDESDAWKVYPPTEESKSDDRLGLKGTKRFKFLLSPLQAGSLTTPTLRFAYLDPALGSYVEKNLSGEPIFVEEVPDMIPAPNSAPAAAKPKTVLTPIRSDDGLNPISLLDTPASGGALVPPQKQKGFLYFQIVPLALFIWAVIVPIARKRALNDPLAKARKAFTKAAQKARLKAMQAAAKKDTNAFFAQSRICLQNLVCARDPSRKIESVSATDVIETLGEEGKTFRREINLLCNGAEAMRYGGEAGEPDALRDAFDKIFAKLEVK
jgi:hypothetical protein